MNEKDFLWPSFVHPTVAERIETIDFFLPSHEFDDVGLEFFDDVFAPKIFIFYHLHLRGLAVELQTIDGEACRKIFFDGAGMTLKQIYDKTFNLTDGK